MNTLLGTKMPLLDALARPFLTFKHALSACDDYWTWRTVQGEVYENVVLVNLDQDDVVIRHKYGVEKLRRADLSQDLQDSLIENFEMAESDDRYTAVEGHESFLRSIPMAHAK